MTAFARFPLTMLLPALLVFAGQADAAAGPSAPEATCTLQVDDAWVRPPPMPMPMMAGFARITNPCAGDIAITGARSAAFASVELHETQVVDGVSRMRGVPSLTVEAGREVMLRPGGLHLMLLRPVSPLASGDVVRVEFLLADGRHLAADFQVRAADAR